MFFFKPHIKKHLGANAMKMMTFSPPPLWELRNFIRIFGEPASSTDICFIQIQLTIGLTKLLKAWRRFQGFYSVMLLWWQWMVVVVGGGNCGCGICLLWIWEMPCTHWCHPKTKSIMAVFHHDHDHHLFKCSQSKYLRENQQFVKARDISGISEQSTYWKKTTHLWEYVANPEIQKNPGQFLINICDIGLPNSSTKKHSNIRHLKPLPMADPIRITPSPRHSLQKFWRCYWKI